jgi:hypothetical protein
MFYLKTMKIKQNNNDNDTHNYCEDTTHTHTLSMHEMPISSVRFSVIERLLNIFH